VVGQSLQNTQINNWGIQSNYNTKMPHELLHTSSIFTRINNKKEDSLVTQNSIVFFSKKIS